MPPGCANAYLTTKKETVIHYYMSEIFVPDSYRGFSFCDPQFKFTWPDAPEVMSEKDKLLPNLDINRLLIEFSE